MSEGPVNRGNEPTLAELLMRTGPLAKLVKDPTAWTDIARPLKDVFLTYLRDEVRAEDQASYVAELCTVYYAHDKKRVIRNLEDPRWAPPQLVESTVNFLERFMAANGQWGYIENQSWYVKSEYVIAIDVNYYPDRSGFTGYPLFHKDTGGNNIFVNLIFDNENDIERTEWFADLAQPSDKRKRWQQSLLPPDHLRALDAARAALLPRFGKNSEVSGGVSKGENTYVSWVDDLVWHSTPSVNRRFKFSAAHAKRLHPVLNHTVTGAFERYDDQLEVTFLGVEILGTMAECPTTELSAWLKQNNLTVQDINFEVGRKAWQALYGGAYGVKHYNDDAEKRGRTDWRITGTYSEAIARDTRLAGSGRILETPVGLSERRRANSLDENRDAIERARRANAGLPRSFLRTWVRILPGHSSELKDITFTT